MADVFPHVWLLSWYTAGCTTLPTLFHTHWHGSYITEQLYMCCVACCISMTLAKQKGQETQPQYRIVSIHTASTQSETVYPLQLGQLHSAAKFAAHSNGTLLTAAK